MIDRRDLAEVTEHAGQHRVPSKSYDERALTFVVPRRGRRGILLAQKPRCPVFQVKDDG
jgi:hypothetical protein